MPKGPKGEKRKADVIGNAVLVMRIATGQVEEMPPSPKSKGPAKGGAARAKGLSPDRRKQIAKKAAKARWEKV